MVNSRGNNSDAEKDKDEIERLQNMTEAFNNEVNQKNSKIKLLKTTIDKLKEKLEVAE
jgi:predicted nuclease with TOPRIM domain